MMISTSVPYKKQRNQFNRCNVLGSLPLEFQQILFLAAECLYKEESVTLWYSIQFIKIYQKIELTEKNLSKKPKICLKKKVMTSAA